MRSLIFDSSTIISLAMNNMLGILKPLKKQFKGEFFIPQGVKEEIIDNALEIRRFKFEAIQIQNEIKLGSLKLYKSDISKELKELSYISNHIFYCNNNPLKMINAGELSALIIAKKLKAEALVIDERTTRFLVESPSELRRIFHKKLHKKIEVNGKNLKLFKEYTKDLKIIRSVELSVAAYQLGLFDKYLGYTEDKELLDAVLWGLRLRGCSISTEEISEITRSV